MVDQQRKKECVGRGQKGQKQFESWDSMRIRHIINKKENERAESGKQKTRHQRKTREKEEDWIGVIHSINRIARKVDIKIPVERKNDRQDSKRGEGIRRCT